MAKQYETLKIKSYCHEAFALRRRCFSRSFQWQSNPVLEYNKNVAEPIHSQMRPYSVARKG